MSNPTLSVSKKESCVFKEISLCPKNSKCEQCQRYLYAWSNTGRRMFRKYVDGMRDIKARAANAYRFMWQIKFGVGEVVPVSDAISDWDAYIAKQDAAYIELIKGKTCADCACCNVPPDAKSAYGWCRDCDEWVSLKEPVSKMGCENFE